MTLPTVLAYKRATFSAQLPAGHLYSPSHCWIGAAGGGRWRVGYTKFALRMLGELVDVQFEKAAGDAVQPGDILGAVEGFKALSDLYCVGAGTFAGGNPALREDLAVLGRDPHGAGWLYELEGAPDARWMTVEAYRDLLDATIDRMLAKQQAEEQA